MPTAIAAGKHIYTEKPTRRDRSQTRSTLARPPREAGVKHGVVQDKLFLPGLRKLKRLVDGGFFGRILSRARRVRLLGLRGRLAGRAAPVAGTTGPRTAAASSLDMFPHWQYVLEQCSRRCGRSTRTSATHIPQPVWTSTGTPYEATADDAAYGIFELEGGIVAQINSSWAVRVYRDELVEFQVDGTAGLRGRRAAQLPRPAPRDHPEAGVEPGPAGHRGLPRPVAGGAGQRRVRQRLQGAVGAVPAPRRRGRPFPGTSRRRPRRAAGRAGPAVGPRGPPARGAGAAL